MSGHLHVLITDDCPLFVMNGAPVPMLLVELSNQTRDVAAVGLLDRRLFEVRPGRKWGAYINAPIDYPEAFDA